MAFGLGKQSSLPRHLLREDFPILRFKSIWVAIVGMLATAVNFLKQCYVGFTLCIHHSARTLRQEPRASFGLGKLIPSDGMKVLDSIPRLPIMHLPMYRRS